MSGQAPVHHTPTSPTTDTRPQEERQDVLEELRALGLPISFGTAKVG